MQQTVMHPLEEIKDKISCVEYASRFLKLPVARPGQRCVSFRQGAKNPTSLLIDERFWHDFGSGLSGDVIDMCAHAKHKGEIGPAIRELSEICGIEGSKIPSNKSFDELTEAAKLFHSMLTSKDREYMHKRRITDETIDALLIGRGVAHHALGRQMEDRITIPYWQSGRVAYMIGRGSDPKYKKLKREEYSLHPVWGIDTLKREGPVIVAEGAFDAMSVYQEGFAVVSAITGQFASGQMQDLLSCLRGRQAVVCMDYDPETGAGQRFTATLARNLFLSGIKTSVVFLNGEGVKVDLSDLYSRGANIKEILASGESYPKHEIKQIATIPDEEERKEALTKFMRFSARACRWPDISEQLEVAQKTEKWSPAWLGALKSELKSPPSEDRIANEISESETVIYNSRLGWYRYDAARGVWIRHDEERLCSTIDKKLGYFSGGNRIRSILNVCRARFSRQEDINTGRMLNFRNGMLDLETLQLYPHSQDYYSTIQLNYAYDSDAKPDKWVDFLAEIMQEDANKVRLLQQMFGFCLSGDCSQFERAFILIGEGANGKSTLLDVLFRMIGEDNCANVALSQLEKSFERIRLKDKMVNIGRETSSSISGCEEILKQIISGESISGEYKYKDAVEFKPRCVCVFALNRLSETKDTSYGFQRKIIFVHFPMRFVAQPHETNERPMKDRNSILSDLYSELPGIINWSLEGLKKLREAGDFVRPPDHDKILNNLLTRSNPLRAYLDEREWPKNAWYNRRDVYDSYKAWCTETNSRPLASHNFWPELKELTKFEERRVSNQRQVQFLESKIF